MKKAGLAVLLLGAALCIPGCGFEEGAGASVTVIQATPTPIPTPTPEATPTPEVTPTPEPVVEQTASGVNVTKQDGHMLRMQILTFVQMQVQMLPGSQV